MFSPPHGSNIIIDDKDGYQKIVIPHKSGAIPQWFSGLLHLLVLGVWLLIPVQIFMRATTGFRHPVEIGFLVVALGVVLAGGSIQLWSTYRALRPEVPEVLLLSKHTMLYDSGMAPFQFFVFKTGMEYWEELFQRRIEADFGPEQLKTLELSHFKATTRLTISDGSRTIDIAAAAREPERKWLFDVLCKYYGIVHEEKNPASEARITAAIDNVRRKSSGKKAKRKAQQCPHCQAPTYIEVDGASKWEVCDACGWGGLIEGQK